LLALFSRAQEVNDQPDLLYRVRRSIVFGSYLTAKPELGDADVMVQLEEKRGDQDWVEALRDRACASGRRFSTHHEDLMWPTREVILLLKQRSRGPSFVYWNEDWVKKKEHQVIFAYCKPVKESLAKLEATPFTGKSRTKKSPRSGAIADS
jgi:hypothetical protein